MTSEKIYQIILSSLADEATEEERRIFTDWLNASDENKAEYEKINTYTKDVLILQKKKYSIQIKPGNKSGHKRSIKRKYLISLY